MHLIVLAETRMHNVEDEKKTKKELFTLEYPGEYMQTLDQVITKA